MKKEDLSKYTEAELIEKIQSEKDTLRRLKMSHAISPIENPMRIRETKRTVARLLTALTSMKKTKKG
ncbi:MAG: 50S ribosomal protein L29 [Cytophagaceae bacterium]|nr:50S ribosomal protein L29 [Cytophagaceae bacterium]MDW8456718.1 50S ribosomal protein L29 [Cytophagaceae bacterium]